MKARVRKAIFPVGGLGTRFLPATKAIPKEMLPILEKPLIQYAVEEALASGIEELIFVTGKGKSTIEYHSDRAFELEELLKRRKKTDSLDVLKKLQIPPGRVVYVRQQEPLGLGHAIWCARHLVSDEPFAVLLADDFIVSKTPCLGQLISQYETWGGNWSAVMEVSEKDVSRYGILDIDRQEFPAIKARDLVEKPSIETAPSLTAIVGRYILSSEIFSLLEGSVSQHDSNSLQEIQLTDTLRQLLKNQDFYGLLFEGERFDCGTPLGMFQATVASALKQPALSKEAFSFLELQTRGNLCPP